MEENQKQPQEVQSNVTAATIKTFSYKKGEVQLNFPINVTDKQQVANTIECMEAAITDLKKETHASENN